MKKFSNLLETIPTYMPHTYFNINVSLFLQGKRQVEVKEIPQNISIPQ